MTAREVGQAVSLTEVELPRPSASGAPGRLSAAGVPEDQAAPRFERRLVALTIGCRWVTFLAGIAYGALGQHDRSIVLAGAALVGWAALATLRPLEPSAPTSRVRLLVVAELLVTTGATAATGGLQSPLVLTPLTGLLLAGYVWGRSAAVGTALAGAFAVLATVALQSADPASQRSASQVAVIFLLCGALGAFGRNLLAEIEAHRAAAIDQATQMATANDLLVSLHTLAQTLPASFELGEVITSIRQRLHAILEATAIVVLVRDDAAEGWRVELAEGVRLSDRLADDGLPRPARRAAASTRPVLVEDRLAGGDDGFVALARSGLYASLRARGTLVGLVGVEHVPAGAYGAEQVELLQNLCGLLALSIDNARWFGRLRTLGADAERARIARELHDSIAQSLAYVTFELERVQAMPGDKHEELQTLRSVVRDIVRDLRETIYALRAGVTEGRDLVSTAAEYVARFSQRTGIRVAWEPDVHARMPWRVEQEVFRILQEALTNIERHSGARQIIVRWRTDAFGALLEVGDDGRGFAPSEVSGDHYGIVGMRERADAIGGRLRIDTRPGGGTRVVVSVVLGARRDDVTPRERRTA